MGKLAVFTDEFKCRDLKLAVCTFCLTGRSPHFGGPIRPDAELVFSFRRLRTNVQLRNVYSALTESRPNAVRCRITTANNHDMLTTGENWRFVPSDRFNILAANATVLLNQIWHSIMHAFKVCTRNACRTRLFRTTRIKHGIIRIEQAAQRLVQADIHAAKEANAFTFHLRDAAVDQMFFHLEVRNTITQQTAGAAFTFIDIDHVTSACKLLCGSKTCRA